MTIFELFIIAVVLSMDAFDVAVCKGLTLRKPGIKHMAIVGAYFGIFQAGMPLLGYFMGSYFSESIKAYDHWVAFALLVLIGVKMIKERFDKEDTECRIEDKLKISDMLTLSLATSIDALAVGVTFAFLEVNILPAVLFIGVVTFILSALGVKIGSVFGAKYKSKAELAGGIILVLLGVKILLEHLGVISF
ncbi:MAG: manganese efflux pump [Clostridiales bacterium]|jgi:putative Mn2+ efflux pump MntP|nr:manganese efflux pump [Clostridiales bacterium]